MNTQMSNTAEGQIVHKNTSGFYVKSNINFKIGIFTLCNMLALFIFLIVLWWLAFNNYDQETMTWQIQNGESTYKFLHLTLLILATVSLLLFIFGLFQLIKNSIEVLGKNSPFKDDFHVKTSVIITCVVASLYLIFWMISVFLGFYDYTQNLVMKRGSVTYIFDLIWMFCPFVLVLSTAITKQAIWNSLSKSE